MKELKEAFSKGFREAWLDYWQPLQWLISKLVPKKQSEKLAATTEKIVWTAPKIFTLIGIMIVLGSLLLALGILVVAIAIRLIL